MLNLRHWIDFKYVLIWGRSNNEVQKRCDALENDMLMHGMAPRKDEWKRKQKKDKSFLKSPEVEKGRQSSCCQMNKKTLTERSSICGPAAPPSGHSRVSITAKAGKSETQLLGQSHRRNSLILFYYNIYFHLLRDCQAKMAPQAHRAPQEPS